MSAGVLSGRSVLVVEDEPILLILMEDMLARLGAARVYSAMRVEEAVRQAKECQVDLAVMDVNLAGQTSYEAAAILQRRGVPLMFLTGYGRALHDARWRDTATLSKPVEINSFVRALQRLLD